MNYNLLVLIFSIIFFLGIFLAIIPGLPVLFFMFIAAVGFAAIDGFVHLTSGNLIVLASIVLLAFIAEFSAQIVGARYGGARMKSALFGSVGLLFGTFIIPIPILGSFIGLFLGIFLSELHEKHKKAEHGKHEKDMADYVKQPFKAALGGFLGALVGSGVNVIAAFVFFVLFLIFALN